MLQVLRTLSFILKKLSDNCFCIGGVSIVQREVVNATGAAVDTVEGDTVKLMYSIYGNPLNLSALRWKRVVGNKSEDISKWLKINNYITK